MKFGSKKMLMSAILAAAVFSTGCSTDKTAIPDTAAKAVEQGPESDGTVIPDTAAKTVEQDVEPAGNTPLQTGAVQGLPELTVSGGTELPGNFFLSFVYTRNLIMMDGRGNIVWSKHEEQPREGVHTGLWDFKKHVAQGKTYYSYHDQIADYDNFGFQGFAPGERVIMDENFNEIKRITFEESDTVEKGHPLDGHDFLMIDPDHYILSGYIKDRIYNHPDHPEGSDVVYSYLQEVDHGKVVWDFKSIDYPELYDLVDTDASDTADDFANEKTDVPDIVHFNAMRLDDEGNLLCSFRHLSTILCLDRTKQEDQILWKLSGKGDDFGLSEDQKTSGQHYVTIDKDKLMVFDNGNRTHSTHIRIYGLDRERRAVNTVKTLDVGGKFSAACGDVQHLTDEKYVIGWGYGVNDGQCMSVYDFGAGQELMSVTLARPENFTYRCVYYE